VYERVIFLVLVRGIG